MLPLVDTIRVSLHIVAVCVWVGGQVVLDILAPLDNFGIVVADASGVASRPIFIPFAVPPGINIWSQAVRLAPNLADSTTSNPIAQTIQ